MVSRLTSLYRSHSPTRQEKSLVVHLGGLSLKTVAEQSAARTWRSLSGGIPAQQARDLLRTGQQG